MNNYLYSKDSETLQIPYNEYVALAEKMEEVQRLQQVKMTVLEDLQRLSGERQKTGLQPQPKEQVAASSEPAASKIPEAAAVSEERTTGNSEPFVQKPATSARSKVSDVPPIQNGIAEHFNKLDASGRLFNVFKQYYTCLNEVCGGTVRVTIKDGFCSLWNYDEWEEFAFIDIFEELLRVTIDPRYTDALKSLSLCEAPRLISKRRNVISVQVDDLNNTVLEILSTAFSEAGVPVGKDSRP